MLRWNNDYNRGAHPDIIAALEKTNCESYCGYGLDDWCVRASNEIKKYLGKSEADIHFLLGGTQANYTFIASALRPYESVICADTGHINVHETGAVENTGHKIHALKNELGKLTASQIAHEAELFRSSEIQEHITEPKMVYLSLPTEYGTVYTQRELDGIRSVCDEYGLLLYIDGARLGYALGCEECDVTLEYLASVCDAFYIGGTKCGALFGEALVILNPSLKGHFRSFIKQNGGMLAKGWLLGLQFYTLFKNGLYFDITKRAVGEAMRIKTAFEEKGVPFFYESPTNQLFVVLDDALMKKLGENNIYEYEARIDETRHCVRFCTSWATVPQETDRLIADIAAL